MKIKIRPDLKDRLLKWTIFPTTSWKEDEWELEDDTLDRLKDLFPGVTDPNELLECLLDKEEEKRPN